MTNIFTQTNEIANRIINFSQSADGALTEVQRLPTGGRGTGGYVTVTGEPSAPDPLISSNAVIVSRDRRYLFTVNAGDNTVSSLRIGADGMLTAVDTQSTGNPVAARFGTANSLAYNAVERCLYVLHSFGPDHIRTFDVAEGRLTLRPAKSTLNLPGLTDRIPTQLMLSPDNRFLLACVLFDARPADSGLALARQKSLAVFPVGADGGLGEAKFTEAGGITPFATCFLHRDAKTFVTVLAAESSAVVSTIAPDGTVTSGKPAKIDTTIDGKMTEPSEMCWVSVTEDDRFAFGANFGFGTVSAFAIDGTRLAVARSAAASEPGDGTFKGLAGVTSSGAGDNAVAGRFLYQLYANASKLVGYRIGDDGSLTKVAEVPVPRNSTQGLAAA